MSSLDPYFLEVLPPGNATLRGPIPINPLFLARCGLKAQAIVRVDGVEQVWRPELFTGLTKPKGRRSATLSTIQGVGRCGGSNGDAECAAQKIAGVVQDEVYWQDILRQFPHAPLEYLGFLPTGALQAMLGQCRFF